MASRNFNRYQALEKEVKTLYAEVAIGASGAPTLTSGLGITSIARTGTGAYTVTLADRYVRLMHVNIIQVDADAEDLTFQVTSSSVNSTTKAVSFVCKAYDGDGAAAAADPSDGSSLLIKVELKNTTAGE
jgi:hypothetical protein